MDNNKWTFKVESHAIADTGDYDEYIQFVSCKDILQSSSEDISKKECEAFCRLLNKMPDLFSRKSEFVKIEKHQLEEESNALIKMVNKLKTGGMCTDAGNVLIDECLSKIIMLNTKP